MPGCVAHLAIWQRHAHPFLFKQDVAVNDGLAAVTFGVGRRVPCPQIVAQGRCIRAQGHSSHSVREGHAGAAAPRPRRRPGHIRLLLRTGGGAKSTCARTS